MFLKVNLTAMWVIHLNVAERLVLLESGLVWFRAIFGKLRTKPHSSVQFSSVQFSSASEPVHKKKNCSILQETVFQAILMKQFMYHPN